MILDTNAFYLPFQFRINLDAELERILGSCRYLVPDSVEREIRLLAGSGKRFSREALSLFEHLSPEVVPGTGAADDDVVELARSSGGALLTLDGPVRKVALTSGIPVVFLRGKKHLVLKRPGPI